MLFKFSTKKLISPEVGANYRLKDGFLAILSLFNIFGIGQKEDLEFCQNWFLKHFETRFNSILNSFWSNSKPIESNAKNFLFTDGGRTSLYLLLKSLGLPAKSEVLIQGFSCVVLPNAIWQSGLKPILCDIEDKSFNINPETLEQKINSKTRVLILQYSFGLIPPNLDKILEICKKYNLVLIEDVAHSLGAKIIIQNQDFWVGSLGHAAIFSFGRDKIVSSTIGGTGVINFAPNFAPNWNLNYKREYEKLPKMSFVKVLQSLSYPILTTFLIRPFYHQIFGKVILVIAKKLKLLANVYTQEETFGTDKLQQNSKYSQKLATLLKNQLKNISQLNAHRLHLAHFYSENLGLKFNPNAVYLRFPLVLANSSVYKHFKGKLRQEGVLIGTWYNSLFMQPNLDLLKFGIHKNDLPIAENLSENRVINLPTNIHVTQKDAQKIINILKK
jgi:perosamine synthetase